MQSHHVFRYRKRGAALADRAEEAYLRLDIPCGSPACAACPSTSPALPPQPAHLALPDAAALATWLEVFELAEVSGVVLLSSVLRQLRDGGSMRRDTRLRALYTDVRRGNVLFDNLHRLETAPASLGEQRCGLALLAAAEWWVLRGRGEGAAGECMDAAAALSAGWLSRERAALTPCRYYEHLGRRLPVVVVSDSLAAQLGGEDAQQQRRQQQQQAGQGRPFLGAGQAPPGCDEGSDDAELDALLQQMHVGAAAAPARQHGGSSTQAPAPDQASIASLLDSLVLDGGQQPAAQPPAAASGPQPLQLGPGVRVLSAAAYFGGCWGHVPAVADAADALQLARAGADEAGRGSSGVAYPPHLSSAALEAGLAAGSLLSGTLSVSRRARGEASVAVGGGRSLLVVGREAMNRAVHGDRVALRLLPREQWRRGGEGQPAGEEEGGEEAGEGREEGLHDLMAGTGDGEADVEPDAPPGEGEGEGQDPLVRGGGRLAPGLVGAGRALVCKDRVSPAFASRRCRLWWWSVPASPPCPPPFLLSRVGC